VKALPAAAADHQPLPHSPESERAFLGAILLGAPASFLESLEPVDFFVPQFSIVFLAMREAQTAGRDASDPVVLYELLADNKLIEEAGGAAFISKLADGIPRVSNVEAYAETIKTKSTVRQRLYLVESLREKLGAANGNALEVLREVSALSAPLRIEVEQKRILGFKTGLDLEQVSNRQVSWFTRGILAKGSITELGAKVKTGKTTWLLKMVEAILDGAPFLGLPTLPTPVVYLTEQTEPSFREAVKRANLLGRKDFISLPFAETYGIPWPEIVSVVTKECQRLGAGVVIVDTVSQFSGLTGDSENNAGDALEAMLPLQRAAAGGIGIVVVRHERKSGGDVGDSGRGSSAFSGTADIVLSLRKLEGNSPKNRRLLQSLSRFDETPNDLLMELTDEGYVALGERQETALKDAKDAIYKIAPQLEVDALTLMELAKGAEIARPTAQRAIDELYRDGMLGRNGKGKKGDPFRYFIPEEIRFCSTSSIEEQENKKSNERDLWDAREPGDD
jgi:DnaB-like helicase N terminal domain/AAA domain